MGLFILAYDSVMLSVLCYILVLWGWCRMLLVEHTLHMLVKCTVVFALYFILWVTLSAGLSELIDSIEAVLLLAMLIMVFPVVFALMHFFGASRKRAVAITALTTLSWVALPFVLGGIAWMISS